MKLQKFNFFLICIYSIEIYDLAFITIIHNYVFKQTKVIFLCITSFLYNFFIL